ncbi:MAG: 7-carboxy-7-deazaguanine synthase QueE [Rickettsiales bacterium]|nr:MAG: 7-carboxy-7-deazaguanine synthase QueE [Rickettsiales bacterium]
MLGNNPKRSAEFGDGSKLKIKNIFKTLQGEGPNVGVPSIFIRLGGCNLACSFCDTDFEDYEEQSLKNILDQLEKLCRNDQGVRVINLIVITGGEPFRQEIEPMCSALLAMKFNVQIETNGTLYRNIPKEVEIICSPKVVANKYLSVHPDLLRNITAFKFLISTNMREYSNVPELGQTSYNIPVFVQAMDEYNQEININNKKHAVLIALNNGYRLSYQIHKDLNIE